MSSLNLPLHETIICSTAAGVSSTLLGHPLDTLKVHIQTNPAFTAKTNNGTSPQRRYRYPTVRAARHLLRSNHYSPLVFFRGIGPPTANAAIMNILTFAVFNRVKEGFGGDGYRASLAAGIISGLASAFVSTPTDYVKIQAQLRGGMSSGAILREIVALRNPASILFRGHVANLGREGVFTCVYLGIYDVAINRATDDTTPWTGGAGTLARIAAISSITGGCAWIVSFPFDTVKSVMQAQSPSKPCVSLSEALHSLYYNSGLGKVGANTSKPSGSFAAFYRGCAASTGRAVLVTSSRMMTYEFVARTFFSTN
mmetsp:Transcript_15521/g.37131  ORF Transcript_15521/g.37131 Transcript_15521/m.37131 type:complete len:312 (+) Transcript_15521:107-1042(+)